MANWLVPALVGSLVSNGILTILHLLIWSQYRQSFLLYWSAAWGSYVLVLGLVTLRAQYGSSLWLLGAQHTIAIISAYLLLAGTKKFISEPIASHWKALGGAGIAWVIISLSVGVSPTISASYSFALIGLFQIYAGYRILKTKRSLGFPCLWAGWCVIVWGVHRADYPLLKDVTWFAPWGFLIAAILTITASMNLLLMYLEQIKSDLQQTHSTLETILGIAPVGIAMGKGETITWSNPYLDHLLGYETGFLVGGPMRRHFYSQEEYDRVSGRFQQALKENRQANMEFRVQHKNGSLIPVAMSGRLVNQKAPRRGYIVALVDLTQRKRSEDALRELAAGVAHNFNNLLMAISSNAEAAKVHFSGPGHASAEKSALLDNVIKASLSGRDISRRLAASVATQDQLHNRGQILDLNEPLHTALDLAAAAHPEIGQTIALENRISQGLMVRGVQGQLVEVFQNLIGNALDALEGEGRLTLWAETNPGSIILCIRDDGKGMDTQTLAKAFDPFFSTKGTQGKGLGLTASQGIIRAHGGDLEITSRPGRGAVAIITLPRADESDRSGEFETQVDDKQTDSILLVEDEAIVAAGLAAILKNAGHQVTQAARLIEAKSALNQNSYGLVLSDVSLPDGSGWELLSHLADLPRPMPPLIFLTGHPQPQTGPLPENGAEPAAILQKPISKESLLAEISKVISGKG